ncbi:MAG: M20/M25/M40 family metallo-hydrolase [Bacteroidia bacterium]
MMKLLEELCAVRATSGDEGKMTEFILDYVVQESPNWKVKPEVFSGPGFQDCVVLSFGKPATAIFAHIDSIGFTVSYNNSLIKIGGPKVTHGIQLVGSDSQGEIAGSLITEDDGSIKIEFHRNIERGTTLTFKPEFRETSKSVQCCYLDNRLGVYVALEVAKTLENGLIVFSCLEEHGGGAVGFLSDFITSRYSVYQALICDITWVTEGVIPGKGVAISMRDGLIPRRSYVKRIIELAKESGISFQLEVESAGGSDGSEIQKSIFPIDWCFIGAPEKHVHSPDEWVNKNDIQSMIKLYSYLLEFL